MTERQMQPALAGRTQITKPKGDETIDEPQTWGSVRRVSEPPTPRYAMAELLEEIGETLRTHPCCIAQRHTRPGEPDQLAIPSSRLSFRASNLESTFRLHLFHAILWQKLPGNRVQRESSPAQADGRI
jgi:hypothetical protein